VTVSDDGGSSGRLRREFDILAPGDIRNCMVALAEDEALMSRLFQYRFSLGHGLRGHSFGNLFLTALTDVTGDFHQAIQFSSEVLAIRGRIYPSTLENVRLEAEMSNGRSMVGESRITRSRSGIRQMRLKPRHCAPLPESLEAIANADLITLGPGSLFTSVIPNLLVDGIAEALKASRAPKVYICNLMGEPGETEGYRASDHLRAVSEHAGGGIINCILVNSEALPEWMLERYAREGASPVEVDRAELEEMRVRVLPVSGFAAGDVGRHDADRLTELLVSLGMEHIRAQAA
jgi:uncharacterized cofD-like protein